MKQNDIVLIMVCVFVAGVISFVLSNQFIAAPKNRQTQVEVVDKLTADFELPDTRYFNNDSVNVTQVIQIGGTPPADQPSFNTTQ